MRVNVKRFPPAGSEKGSATRNVRAIRLPREPFHRETRQRRFVSCGNLSVRRRSDGGNCEGGERETNKYGEFSRWKRKLMTPGKKKRDRMLEAEVAGEWSQ